MGMPKTLKQLCVENDVKFANGYYWLDIQLIRPTGKIGKSLVFDEEDEADFKRIVHLYREKGMRPMDIGKALGRKVRPQSTKGYIK